MSVEPTDEDIERMRNVKRNARSLRDSMERDNDRLRKALSRLKVDNPKSEE